MELKTLKCPNCSGVLDVDDGLDIFFCKYCGQKIILSGQSDAAYKAKAKAKEYDYELEKIKRKNKNKQETWERKEISKKNDFKMMFIYIAIIISLFVAYHIYDNLSDPYGFKEKRKLHLERIDELKKIELQIEEDIEDEDWEHALLLTNKLRLNDNWSSSDTKEWDDRREGYIKQIERLQEKDK